jgi:hypothetical protein
LTKLQHPAYLWVARFFIYYFRLIFFTQNQHSMTTSSIATMTTAEIAAKLVELCRIGQYETAHHTLYADDAISIEPTASPEFEKETKGINAILEKGRKFDSMVEAVHGGTVSEPLVAGNAFSFVLTMDVTMKGQGRFNMVELCVYQVKDGKIVSEEFFM